MWQLSSFDQSNCETHVVILVSSLYCFETIRTSFLSMSDFSCHNTHSFRRRASLSVSTDPSKHAILKSGPMSACVSTSEIRAGSIFLNELKQAYTPHEYVLKQSSLKRRRGGIVDPEWETRRKVTRVII
jgi:hypothetical protein